jgi:hypothetical protein
MMLDILRAHQTPRFSECFAYDPMALPLGDRIATVHYAGEGEKSATFTNVMVTERFVVSVFWLPMPERSTWIEREQEIWDCSRTLQAAFRADSTLGGSVTDMGIGNARTGYLTPQGDRLQMYRTLQFELELECLEEEAISA